MIIKIKQATKQGYIEMLSGGVADLSFPDSKTRRGRVEGMGNISPTITATGTGVYRIEVVAMRGRNPGNPNERTAGIPTQQHLELQKDGISNALTSVQNDNMIMEQPSKYRIRRLTPREWWRLMGFSDDNYNKAEKVVSQSQLYKQAGNSIVVDVLEAIFNSLNIEQEKL